MLIKLTSYHNSARRFFSHITNPEFKNAVLRKTCVCASMFARFRLQYNSYHIRVWLYRGELTLLACIPHCDIGPTLRVIMWSPVRYTFWSSIFCNDSTVISDIYNSVGLKLLPLPFIGVLRKAKFLQDNTWSYIIDIFRIFLDSENVRLLS